MDPIVSSSDFMCPVCGNTRLGSQRRSSATLPGPVLDTITSNHPGWSPEEDLCSSCATDGKMAHLETMLLDDGRISDDEAEVLTSIRTDAIVASDGEDDFEAERQAEPLVFRLARTFGSWAFLSAILAFLVVWLVVNVVGRPFDPYPVIIFAVTSAVLASLAALQGPIIIMSQRQQRERDRRRARADYRVNLKAELEIRYLDEKIDRVLWHQHRLADELAALQASQDRAR